MLIDFFVAFHRLITSQTNAKREGISPFDACACSRCTLWIAISLAAAFGERSLICSAVRASISNCADTPSDIELENVHNTASVRNAFVPCPCTASPLSERNRGQHKMANYRACVAGSFPRSPHIFAFSYNRLISHSSIAHGPTIGNLLSVYTAVRARLVDGMGQGERKRHQYRGRDRRSKSKSQRTETLRGSIENRSRCNVHLIRWLLPQFFGLQSKILETMLSRVMCVCVCVHVAICLGKYTVSTCEHGPKRILMLCARSLSFFSRFIWCLRYLCGDGCFIALCVIYSALCLYSMKIVVCLGCVGIYGRDFSFKDMAIAWAGNCCRRQTGGELCRMYSVQMQLSTSHRLVYAFRGPKLQK